MPHLPFQWEKLADSIGRKKLICAGYFLFMLVSCGLCLLSPYHLCPSFCLLWHRQCNSHTNQRAQVADLASNVKLEHHSVYFIQQLELVLYLQTSSLVFLYPCRTNNVFLWCGGKWNFRPHINFL